MRRLTPLFRGERRRRRRSCCPRGIAARNGFRNRRRVDLSLVIEARFGVRLAERRVGDVLRRLGFRRLPARPRHKGFDAAAAGGAQKNLPLWPPPR
ncbi:MAG: helix-turn-helix domain-containing protein [Methylocella sp.]